MRTSLVSMEEAPITPYRSDVIFTREQFSQDLPLRPLAIKHDLKSLHYSESRLSSNDEHVHGSAAFDSRSTRRSAFLQRRPPSNEQTSPKYYLPMKRCTIIDITMVTQRHQTQQHPSTPDTMMSSLESIHSTPQSCHSRNFDYSPPNLNYQSPNFLVEHEKSVPANILLPSL
jgi:hypothetical protein